MGGSSAQLEEGEGEEGVGEGEGRLQVGKERQRRPQGEIHTAEVEAGEAFDLGRNS